LIQTLIVVKYLFFKIFL